MNKPLEIVSTILISFSVFLISIFLIRHDYFNVTSLNEHYIRNIIVIIVTGIAQVLVILLCMKTGDNIHISGTPNLEKLLYLSIYAIFGMASPIFVVYEVLKANIGQYALMSLLCGAGAMIYLLAKQHSTRS